MTVRLIAALLTALVLGAAPPVQVFFGPKAADDPASLYFNLMRFLDSATVTLDAAVHEIDMISVAEKLAERSRAGVKVQLVVEADWWRNEKNTAAREVLTAAGITVVPDTKKSGLMHDKFFIADGRRVWTGSTNVTETCLFYNPNNSVWIESDKLAVHFQAEFDDMRAGRFGKRKRVKTELPTQTVALGGTKIRAFFSPQDAPLAPIVEVIDAAKTSVDLMCFVFSSEDVGGAVLRAHRRGVKVRVLLDNAFSSEGITRRWPFVPYKEFVRAGVPCKYDDAAAKLHHKVVVVDRATTLTGSFNFSANAAGSNDENLLIIDDPAVARQYTAEFERLWAMFKGPPGDAPAPERGDGD
jgi:phosphatidylserine/phosphatidylglycerophosphate/cardiolipin synthase-like enzyme